MKITQMLEREDFYEINAKTLTEYYGVDGKETVLFIYPKLNAIVTANPSAEVREYLLCEYSVRGSLFKRMLVRLYVWLCLLGRGCFATERVDVHANLTGSILIYPCNKKYRIFDFESGTCDVIGKHGFDKHDLNHEIEFRKRNGLPEFVPTLLSSSENGYTEKIIDGKPLARITEGYADLRDRAYEEFRIFSEKTDHDVICREYIGFLARKIEVLLTRKVPNKYKVSAVMNGLEKKVTDCETVILTFSHGDFQAGNIWVENVTNKIFIIDWESWGERSVWYDRAVLYDGLRPGGIEKYLSVDIDETEKCLVLLEDIVFRLEELNYLPEDCGTTQFSKYINAVYAWLHNEMGQLSEV